MIMDEDFDWVEARVKCNVRKIFDLLRSRVESDTKSAERHDIVHAVLENRSQDQFIVKIPDPAGGMSQNWRTFFLGDVHIEVRGRDDDNKPILTARASLTNRDCKVEVYEDGREPRHLRLWEFSRLVLEPLLFRGR